MTKAERHRVYMKKRYAEDAEFKAKHLVRVAANNKKYLARFNAVIAEFRAGGCVLCPETESCTLSAHHVDPSQKDFEMGYARSRKMSLDKVRAELKKCVCLCMNCHAKVHAKVMFLGP